jgi:hypothetical protein
MPLNSINPCAAAKAMAEYADIGDGFAAHTDLVATGGLSAAAVDACSFRNGGKTHDSLLTAFTVDARVLRKL